MRTLVTGGAGFIGSHLTERLCALGARVVLLDDFSTGRRENLAAVKDQIEVHEGSITDDQTVRKALAGCGQVFHLAGLASVQQSLEQPLRSHEVNATSTLRLLEAARQAGAERFVFAGSSSAYGDLPGGLRRESDAPQALSPYAAAKLAAELYAEAYAKSFGMKTVRLRFFNVYGPRQAADSPYSGVISLFIRLLKDGKAPTIYGDGLQTRDFVYVADVVDALILAAEKKDAAGQAYHVGSGQATTLLQLVETLGRIQGNKIEPRFQPARAGDVRHSQADMTLSRKELGFEAKIALEDGLRKTWEWFA